jgi:hypothetical protein
VRIEGASGAWRGEEASRGLESDFAEENAREGTPWKVVGEFIGEREDEFMGFDDGTPRAADAAGPGEGVRGEAVDDVQEHIVGEAEAIAAAVAGVHRDGAVADDARARAAAQESSLVFSYARSSIDRAIGFCFSTGRT